MVSKETPHRLTSNDFSVLAPWLFPKLRQRYANYTDQRFLAVLNSFTLSNHTAAYCTANSIAVGVTQDDLRDLFKYGEMLWVAHNDGYLEEALDCIDAIAVWAKRMNCKDFRFIQEGDVPLESIKARMKPKRVRNYHICPLE
jgi:hypothetical protein